MKFKLQFLVQLIYWYYIIECNLKNKNNFHISLLTTNKNYKLLLNQAIKFNVKNVITDAKTFNISKNIFKIKN